MPAQLCRGEALPRPPRLQARHPPWHASTTSPTDPPPCPSPHHGVPGPPGRRVRHRLTPTGPGRSADSGPAGTLPGKSAHLGGARRRVACRTSVARQMGRHISDDADQCAAQPPHHRLPGRVLGVPTGSVTVRGENHWGHSPSRLQPAAGRRLSAANLLRPAARGDAPSQPPSGGLRIQPGASAPGALAPTPP
jgi:hypothetical protein